MDRSTPDRPAPAPRPTEGDLALDLAAHLASLTAFCGREVTADAVAVGRFYSIGHHAAAIRRAMWAEQALAACRAGRGALAKDALGLAAAYLATTTGPPSPAARAELELRLTRLAKAHLTPEDAALLAGRAAAGEGG